MQYYTIDRIKQIMAENPNVKIIYFWGHTPTPNRINQSCLSQWYDCKFEADILEPKKMVTFHTAEQFMMASKALLFQDNKTYEKIMNENHPSAYKKLGRLVKNFNPEVWDLVKYDVVIGGNKLKFSQNKDLKNYLLSTGDAILVEASPYDKIWGIGIDKDTALKGGVDDWKGENLLGFALMEVRDWLKHI